jgi:hypothetical protein
MPRQFHSADADSDSSFGPTDGLSGANVAFLHRKRALTGDFCPIQFIESYSSGS